MPDVVGGLWLHASGIPVVGLLGFDFTALGERQRRDALNNWQDEGDNAARDGRCNSGQVTVETVTAT
jgi:hypothetical protein